MKIIDAQVFAGPNVHAPVPVIRLLLDLQRLADRSPASLGDRFRNGLLELVPDLDPAAFDSARVDAELAGAGFALLVAEIALELQRNLGAEVGYRGLQSAGGHTRVVVYELWDEAVALPAAQLAIDTLLGLIEASQAPGGPAWNAPEQRERMLKRLRPESLDLITMALVREAVRRAIPWYRLVARKPFVQLGQGRRQKHIRESASNQTSSTARYLSKDKNATSLLLGRVGIPVPAQRLVTSVDEALDAANAIGYPVVTKPLDRGNGKGVSVGLEHADAVRWGYAEARRYGEQVIVERFVGGDDHRILVIDGRMVAAAKRIPGHVVGDGVLTVAELVEAANRDPRRGAEYEKLMVRLEFDAQAEQVLEHAGLKRDSIPQRGQHVPLRRTANVSTGGTCVDVTEIVHPDNREAAIRASRVLGLDIAGVDFLTTDITRSYREVGGGICEVNFSPGLRPHWNSNPSRDVIGPIVDTMFPAGSQSRIPIAALMGGSGVDEVCRLLARLLGSNGLTLGAATRRGVEIDGVLVAQGDHANAAGGRTLLFDPMVEAAIIECDPDQVLRQGLPMLDCTVAAVTGSGESAPQSKPGLDQRISAARVLLGSAVDAVVLDADDPSCSRLLELTGSRRVGLVSARAEAETVRAHIDAGGLAAVCAGSGPSARLVVYDARKVVLDMPAADIQAGARDARPASGGALTAVAVAICLGMVPDRIRKTLVFPPA